MLIQAQNVSVLPWPPPLLISQTSSLLMHRCVSFWWSPVTAWKSASVVTLLSELIHVMMAYLVKLASYCVLLVKGLSGVICCGKYYTVGNVSSLCFPVTSSSLFLHRLVGKVFSDHKCPVSLSGRTGWARNLTSLVTHSCYVPLISPGVSTWSSSYN